MCYNARKNEGQQTTDGKTSIMAMSLWMWKLMWIWPMDKSWALSVSISEEKKWKERTTFWKIKKDSIIKSFCFHANHTRQRVCSKRAQTKQQLLFPWRCVHESFYVLLITGHVNSWTRKLLKTFECKDGRIMNGVFVAFCCVSIRTFDILMHKVDSV